MELNWQDVKAEMMKCATDRDDAWWNELADVLLMDDEQRDRVRGRISDQEWKSFSNEYAFDLLNLEGDDFFGTEGINKRFS
jgi:hypothetical protein